MTALLSLLLLLAVPTIAQEQPQPNDPYPRWTMAQKYAAKGFHPVDCFGGQVKIRGKRLAGQPFSVFKANAEMNCCGPLVKTATTDKHGHFFVEPLQQGEYFVQFEFNGVRYVTNFAVTQSYTECGATHVEISFSSVTEAQVQTYVDIDDSGEPCEATEPHCFRK